jgi:hypothetical protein
MVVHQIRYLNSSSKVDRGGTAQHDLPHLCIKSLVILGCVHPVKNLSTRTHHKPFFSPEITIFHKLYQH